MTNTYFDKHGVRIEDRMQIRDNEGAVDFVLECGEGDDVDLGIDCTNFNSPVFAKTQRLIAYPLSSLGHRRGGFTGEADVYDLSDYEIVTK